MYTKRWGKQDIQKFTRIYNNIKNPTASKGPLTSKLLKTLQDADTELFNKYINIRAGKKSDRVLVGLGIEKINICDCGEPCLVKSKSCSYKCSASSDAVIKKTRTTNLEKYGCENPFGNKEIQQQIKETNLEKYGCENPFSNKKIKRQIKKTNLEKYGCENPAQSKSVRKRMERTNKNRYGFKHPLQNREVLRKMESSRFTRKEFVLNGRKHYIQGFESQAIRYCVDTIGIIESKIRLKKVPSFEYKKPNNKSAVYNPDFLIKRKNRDIIVEVKSTFTFLGTKTNGFFETNCAKAKAVIKDTNYKFILMLMNKSGDRIVVPKNWYNMSRKEVMSLINEKHVYRH